MLEELLTDPFVLYLHLFMLEYGLDICSGQNNVVE